MSLQRSYEALDGEDKELSVNPSSLDRFDRRLMRLRGEAMGKEFRGKGVHVALGPMMCVYLSCQARDFVTNILLGSARNMGRVPEGGRNWEGL